MGRCRSIPTLADSLLFQHRPSFESGSALGASFPTRMLGVHLLCKELKPKQPKTEIPGLKARACALSITRGESELSRLTLTCAPPHAEPHCVSTGCLDRINLVIAGDCGYSGTAENEVYPGKLPLNGDLQGASEVSRLALTYTPIRQSEGLERPLEITTCFNEQ
jgi:hypothetical protein